MASMNNELLLHGKGSSFTHQRRSSPQPRSNNQNKQMDGRRGGRQNGRLSASAKAFQPAPRSMPGTQQDVATTIDKAELAQQVLASISIKRKEDQDRMLGLYPSDPQRRSDRRGSKHDWRKNDEKHHHKSKNGKHHHAVQKQADLGMNRFRFILSPSSCYCDSSMEDILAMQTTDIWPHISAVVTCDVDPICSICLDGIHAGRALACGHVFCAVCIHRCLEAAEADPMLQKCPVCSEGALSKSQLRRCIVLKSTPISTPSYSLVTSTPRTALAPLLITDRIMSNRVMVATGEGMLKMVDKERKEIAECRRDLERFRDAQGLRLIQEISAELDKAHVEWQRHVGRARARMDVGAMTSGEQVEWTYQRSDGSLEFLHPVNLRCLLSNCHGDVSLLPERITAANVLEVEEWSNRKFGSMVKLGPMHLPEFPPSIKIVEVALEGISEEATQTVEKETKDRARRREEREVRKLKHQLKVMEAEATVEEKRRRAREQEEELIRAFFGFEQRRAEEELKEAKERPQPAINSFSAVVSSMGHFPVLTKSPTLEPSKASAQQKTRTSASPQLEPLRSAWGSASPTPAPSLSLNSQSSLGNSEQASSFAQAATQGPGKKVLWQNNPSRRAW